MLHKRDVEPGYDHGRRATTVTTCKDTTMQLFGTERHRPLVSAFGREPPQEQHSPEGVDLGPRYGRRSVLTEPKRPEKQHKEDANFRRASNLQDIHTGAWDKAYTDMLTELKPPGEPRERYYGRPVISDLRPATLNELMGR